ncbi:MAG: carboxypeptidase-like regulatory domain-containing protein [Pseudomonadota bacterium]
MGNITIYRYVVLLALFCAAILSAAPAHAGHISGTIRLDTPDGQTINGDWIRVLLTTAAVAPPNVPALDGLAALARYDRIVSAHMDFYVRYQQHLSQAGYLVASVLTDESGAFKFVDVVPGRYFIVVTFPSTVGGYKVAWQVPVSVPATGDPASVSLDWHNMLLPTQKH